MTTTVTIQAHCSDDTHVLVVVTDDNGFVEGKTLENGEEATLYAHDDRAISVREDYK